MNFMKRAQLYIVRKKGKSILLFMLLLVMSTFILTALAFGSASENARLTLQKSLDGSFTIGFDYTENNPYLKVENVDGGTIIYSTQQIASKLVEKIRGIGGVAGCSASVESLAVFPELKLFNGTIPIEEEFRQSSKTLGTWKSEELLKFTSGQLTLSEGRHIVPEDKNKTMISKDLADKNGLKIGDMIKTGSGIRLEIVGLFSPKEVEGVNVSVTAYDKLQNLMICDIAAMVAMEDGPAISGFDTLTVAVENPQNMDSIISKVKEIKDVDWRGFSIISDNSDFEKAAAPLKQLSNLISGILIVGVIVSIVILSLILTMWARGRIHETGILLSAGISKLSVLAQYAAEVLMLAMAAFLFSYFLSCFIAGGLTFGRQPEIQVHISLKNVGVLFLIGSGIAAASASISSVFVMRLKPREILSKMN